MTTARARCLCGDLIVTATLPSRWVAHCHCTLCQRAHGAGVVTWAGFDSNGCVIDDPQQHLRWYASSPGAERGFCSRCGASLLFRSDRWPGELHITRAHFIDPLDREPQVHVYYDSHAEWLIVGDRLPRKNDPASG